jgi:hypothetical protein
MSPDATPIRLVAMAEPGGSALVRRVERLLAAPVERPTRDPRPHVALAFAAVVLALVATIAPRVEAGWHPIGASVAPRAVLIADLEARGARLARPGEQRFVVVRTDARAAGRPGAAGGRAEQVIVLDAIRPARQR